MLPGQALLVLHPLVALWFRTGSPGPPTFCQPLGLSYSHSLYLQDLQVCVSSLNSGVRYVQWAPGYPEDPSVHPAVQKLHLCQACNHLPLLKKPGEYLSFLLTNIQTTGSVGSLTFLPTRTNLTCHHCGSLSFCCLYSLHRSSILKVLTAQDNHLF